MRKEHGVLLAMFLAAVAVQIGTLEHGWRDAASPGFVAGLLGQLAIVIRAFYMDKVGH